MSAIQVVTASRLDVYKRFDEHPFPAVWDAALETLSDCHTLVVVGYSFPPTDFRTPSGVTQRSDRVGNVGTRH